LINSAVSVTVAAGWSNPRDGDVIDLAMSEAQAHKIKTCFLCLAVYYEHLRLAVVMDSIRTLLTAPY